jgi:hypothetical protein
MLKFKVNMVGMKEYWPECPVCRSEMVAYAQASCEGGIWYAPRHCGECGAHWDEILTPAFVTNVKKP